MKKNLKLTKLTIANLDRVKGGIGECGCPIGDDRLANYNYNVARTITCKVCTIPTVEPC